MRSFTQNTVRPGVEIIITVSVENCTNIRAKVFVILHANTCTNCCYNFNVPVWTSTYYSFCVFSCRHGGFFANNLAHSCKDIRDSEDSKVDGEYWIDPEKSGNPLKVFCDMTTDGGKEMIMI